LTEIGAMPEELGLTPVECVACGHSFLESVSRLKTALAVACPRCSREIPVTEIESRDATLARILSVLREQERLKRQ
jgi:DNA-directed RNA polymerase subunit RPC12/RpoP